jgi:hypothetical protein
MEAILTVKPYSDPPRNDVPAIIEDAMDWLVFSDTILVCFELPKVDKEKSNYDELIRHVLTSTTFFVTCHFLLSEFFNEGLSVRGGITTGEYYINSQNGVFAGKSIIESFRLAASQDWSGCAVDQKCLDALAGVFPLDKSAFSQLIVPYKIPVKNGCRAQGMAVTWFPSKMNDHPRRAVIRSFQAHGKVITEAVFSKITNTELFIEYLLERRERLTESDESDSSVTWHE